MSKNSTSAVKTLDREEYNRNLKRPYDPAVLYRCWYCGRLCLHSVFDIRKGEAVACEMCGRKMRVEG